MTFPRPIFSMSLLLVVSFTLATSLQPRAVAMKGVQASEGLLKVVLGDGRRMFANHYFIKADEYFHSGYYPSLIQQGYAAGPAKPAHIAERHEDGKDDDDDKDQEPGMNFNGKPMDWIDAFGRHFHPSTHTHLDKPGAAREILPWLKLSSELDPQRIDTYTVASYWLRHNMHKTDEAEAFLREGLKANPSSYEILYELGVLYFEDRHDSEHALNLLELALQRWHQAEAANKKPEPITCDYILAHLSTIEEDRGHFAKAVDYLRQELEVTPSPDAIRKRIEELQQKIAAPGAAK